MLRTLIAIALVLLALPAAAAEVTQGTVEATDGQTIAYDIRGAEHLSGGKPALVFIHCWSCNRAFWREQLDVFAEDHAVVALDLPGHGASSRSRQDWTLAAYAQDVATVVEALELDRVVLIGHSMGGPVALLAAALLPDRTLAVVCADTLHDADFKVPQEQMDQWLAALRQDFKGQVRHFMGTMVLKDDALRQWIVEQALLADQAALIQLMGEIGRFDQAAAMQAAAVPIRCINAKPYGGYSMPTNVEANRKYGDFAVIEMEGVGHFVQLEDPATFNSDLEQILTEVEQR
ncbi:MAG TPA: alpha/beta hydrolase [Kiloniellales bacterium]|nr:alpha/beta hydrolase [Kiloniellales bacterium]